MIPSDEIYNYQEWEDIASDFPEDLSNYVCEAQHINIRIANVVHGDNTTVLLVEIEVDKQPLIPGWRQINLKHGAGCPEL